MAFTLSNPLVTLSINLAHTLWPDKAFTVYQFAARFVATGDTANALALCDDTAPNPFDRGKVYLANVPIITYDPSKYKLYIGTDSNKGVWSSAQNVTVHRAPWEVLNTTSTQLSNNYLYSKLNDSRAGVNSATAIEAFKFYALMINL